MIDKKITTCFAIYVITFLPLVDVQFQMQYPMQSAVMPQFPMHMGMNMPMQLQGSMQMPGAMPMQRPMQMPGPIYVGFRNQTSSKIAIPNEPTPQSLNYELNVQMPLQMNQLMGPSPIAMYCSKKPRPLDCPPCPPCKCAPSCTPPQFSSCSPCHFKCRCQATPMMPPPMQQMMPMSYPGYGMPVPQVMIAPIPRSAPIPAQYTNNISDDEPKIENSSSDSDSDSDSDTSSSSSSQEKSKHRKKKFVEKKKKRRSRRSITQNLTIFHIAGDGTAREVPFENETINAQV